VVKKKKVGKPVDCAQRSHPIDAAMAPHIKALNALTATARFMRRPFLLVQPQRHGHVGAKVSHVKSECWSA
jgi:hypothetical protein